jgi:hypothetical protein
MELIHKKDNSQKIFATNLATGASLSQHLSKISVDKYWQSNFFSKISYFKIRPFIAHVDHNFTKLSKNIKFKKWSLSPHLNCLLPHVANGGTPLL